MFLKFLLNYFHTISDDEDDFDVALHSNSGFVVLCRPRAL